MPQTRLPNAQVTWTEDGVPVSTAFRDPYFAREDGIGETRHVFLAANSLPERWRDTPHFTIAELGFGTGLNFLATVAAWHDTAPERPKDSALTFVSFEAAPLTPDDMARALAAWPELSQPASRLLAHWPATFTQDRFALALADVTLELYLGDANQRLDDWPGIADAWYLDGFSPACNPDLWHAGLIAKVFEKTAPGGTFATYTAAGWVRRNLLAAGFEVEKFPGYGRKRESLRGRRPQPG